MRQRRTIILVLLLAIISATSFIFMEKTQATGGQFRDYDTFMTAFKNLANSYPSLVTYETIGKTVENKDMIMFKIGNPAADKVLFDGAIHGEENLGSELLYSYTKWLLTSNNPLANQILTRTYTLLVPAVDIDEYRIVRTNAHHVDLNRNFETNWASGGDSDPTSWSYRGPAPLSEPESQTLVSVFKTLKPRFYVNLHRGGEIYYISNYNNVTYCNSLFDKIDALSRDRGVFQYPRQFIYGRGYAMSDAARLGITSFLFEVIDWDTSITLSEIETIVLPRFLPVAIVLSQECESQIFFKDGFESGGFAAWSSLSLTSGDSATIINTDSYKGMQSAEFETGAISSGQKNAYAYKTLKENDVISARGYFYIAEGLPLTDDDDRFSLISLRSSGGEAICGLQVRRTQGEDRFNLFGTSGPTTSVQRSIADTLPKKGIWFSVELYAYIHATAGAYKIYVDGTEKLSVTGMDTTRYGGIAIIGFGLVSINIQHKVVIHSDCATISTSYIGTENRADINDDGIVNIRDLGLLVVAWLATADSERYDRRCDLNNDGIINILDLARLAAAYQD